jgi:hypothetical protein
MAAVLDMRLRQAQAEKMVPIDLVSALVTDELHRRQDRLLERRHKLARFRDPDRSLDNFDVDFNKKMNRALIYELATARFIAQREDALFLGPPGTGKSQTNSELSALRSSNLPQKTNFRNHTGLDALTGKSNFDISEWMLLRVLDWLNGREATMAMLCKTAVARKLLVSAWKDSLSVSYAEIQRIDAMGYFGASVDACLLVCEFSRASRTTDCLVTHLDASADRPTTIGYRDGHLVANMAKYDRWKHLAGPSRLRWRSDIKHDCGQVMELRNSDGQLTNGLGEAVEIEDDFIYPMLKTSEVAATPVPEPSRWMVVTQSTVGEDTNTIRDRAPLTWAYLGKNGAMLDRRGSSIYRNLPRFSIFGIGTYSFAPWKVVISGFYKRLHFKVVGPFRGKPVVVDDQSYFLPCESRAEADTLAALLNSDPAREFYEAFVFWDAKRPITVDVLARLDLEALARHARVQPTVFPTAAPASLAEHVAPA